MLTPTQPRPRRNPTPLSSCPQVHAALSWDLATPLPRAGKMSFTHPAPGGSAFLIFCQVKDKPTPALATAPECGRGWACGQWHACGCAGPFTGPSRKLSVTLDPAVLEAIDYRPPPPGTEQSRARQRKLGWGHLLQCSQSLRKVPVGSWAPHMRLC